MLDMFKTAEGEIGRVFEQLLDRKELQSLQDEFCRVAHVFAYCQDGNRERLTECSGNPREVQAILGLCGEEALRPLLERVEGDSIEEQAVEEVGSDVCAAVLSVRASGQLLICWVVMGVLSDAQEDFADVHMEGEGARDDRTGAALRITTRVTREGFEDALDLLRDTGCAIIKARLACMDAEAQSRRSRMSETEMGRTLRTIEATTEIVQLLDSDEKIEIIMNRLLYLVGAHLHLDSAEIYSRYPDGENMDILVEWEGSGQQPEDKAARQIPAYSFLNEDKPVVYSESSGLKSTLAEEAAALGLRAFAVFPVLKQKSAGTIFLFLGHEKHAHVWSMQELKFTADTVKILQSILTRRLQKNSLVSSYEVLEAVLDNVGCAIYVRDKTTGKVLFTNRICKSVFAREIREGTLDGLLEEGIPSGHGKGTYEINHRQRERWYDLYSTEIAWVDGSRVLLCSLYDITDKKQYQSRIEQQAYTDFLTGLYNRLCCERDLNRHIQDAMNNNGTGALLYLDLDDFKHINDGLGHQYGDVLLKSISHALLLVEGIRNTCYRMGGDEFVIIIPPECYDRARQILDDIHQIFSRPWYLKDADYYCTMSMGVVTFPDEGDSVEDLIKKADIAMYEAKRGGKNRMIMYSNKLDVGSGRRLDMEKNMRDAVMDGNSEFQVYFQPIINIQGEETHCAGAEALVRWNSDKLGFISPAEFIPLAEYLGLINPIGNYVLVQACRHCKEWNDNGYPNLTVHVNLSVVQLLQPDIVDSVDRTLKETGIRPENLTLEVTESLAINDMDRMKEILNHIKRLGVKIALDDFGTGYSSLNHIREIPFDVIKVDQSFVKDLAEDAYSKSFIKLVAGLAETIGACVCVEGIETQEQYTVLQGMNVRYTQGYLFDRPMPIEEFEKKYVPGLVKQP